MKSSVFLSPYPLPFLLLTQSSSNSLSVHVCFCVYSLNEFQTCMATKKSYPPPIPTLVGEMWVGSLGDFFFQSFIKDYSQQDLNLKLFQMLAKHIQSPYLKLNIFDICTTRNIMENKKKKKNHFGQVGLFFLKMMIQPG